MAMGERNPVSKALELLTWMVESGATEIGVRDLASAVGLSPSSVHRLLVTLVAERFVDQNASGRYSIGLKFLRLGNLVMAKLPLTQAAVRHMRVLVSSCNETALLGVYDASRLRMMFAATVESSHPLRYAIALNEWGPLHAGASGLGILSFLSDDEINRFIRQGGLARLTDRTIIEPYRLWSQIEEVRKLGYALTSGQRIAGAVGISAPVFGSDGRVLGDVCLTMPEQRFDERAATRLVQEVTRCVDCITADLGGRPPVRLVA
jgi:DNA-binding IclR family transcriptional regulator